MYSIFSSGLAVLDLHICLVLAALVKRIHQLWYMTSYQLQEVWQLGFVRLAVRVGNTFLLTAIMELPGAE